MKTKLLLFVSLLTFTALTVRPCQLIEPAAPATAAAPPAQPIAQPPQPVAGQPLRAAGAGRIWEVYVQDGAAVQPGQLLAKVAAPLNSLERQHHQRAFNQAKHHYVQLLAAAAPEATLAQARRNVAAAGQRLASTPKTLTFTFITAPVAGTVSHPLAAGTYVSDSTTVVQITPTIPAGRPVLAAN